jgi:RNA polymerase sigma-70 factor (ECF subfamily)
MGADQKDQVLDRFACHLISSKAKRLIGQFGFRADEEEDIRQDLTCDLLDRLRKYDPRRSKRTTFTKMVVEQRISWIIEHRTAGKRDYRLRRTSLNEEIRDGEGGATQRLDTISADDVLRAMGVGRMTVEEQMDLRIDLERAAKRLSRELRWLFESLKTKTLAEISRETGIPRSTLNNRMEKLRRTLEDSGLKEYL